MAGSRRLIKHLNQQVEGSTVQVNGWVRSIRGHRRVQFVDVNDGTQLESVQIVAEKEKVEELSVGSSVEVKGRLVRVRHKDGSEKVEVQAEDIQLIGKCDTEDYPLQKKYHSLEFLRENLHLRARTNTFGAVARVRNALTQSIHSFFQDRDFIQMHTPILTTNDAEGAGELFHLSNPFFNEPTHLTVSGQLHAEMYACGLSNVYTFGPTFRAEKSHTSRHLAEFWMVEPEMAFAGLDECTELAESAVKHTINHVLNQTAEDIAFFTKTYDPELTQRLESVLDKPFVRMTYTEAIQLLQQCSQSFNYPVVWGEDLQTEHERYLAEIYVKGPVIVTDYPKRIKPFYMRSNEEDPNETVACMDLLVPRIGELIGGSVREERLDKLNLPSESLDWYRDLRKYGTVPHAGWGLGFERLVLFATGMSNIRDVIPVPRVEGSCPF